MVVTKNVTIRNCSLYMIYNSQFFFQSPPGSSGSGNPVFRIFGKSAVKVLRKVRKTFLTPNSLITIQNLLENTLKTEKLNVGFVALITNFLLLEHPFWLVSVGAPSTWRCDMAHIGSLTLLWCWYCDPPLGGLILASTTWCHVTTPSVSPGWVLGVV